MTTINLPFAWWVILPVALTALIVIGAFWLWWQGRHQPDALEGAKGLAGIAGFFIALGWALVLYGRWTA